MRTLAIIPCFNEEKSIPALLREFESFPSITPLVIDDGSKDQTYRAASASAKCLKLPINLGIGGAVQTGIIYAYREGFDYCVQVDGDGQHRPDEIQKLLNAQKQTGADLVIGSRFSGESEFLSTGLRRIGIELLRKTIRIFYQEKIMDPTSGFRLMNRNAMACFIKNYPQDFPEPISIAQLLNNALKVAEVSVKMRAREHGQSSIHGWKNLSYMLRVIGYLIIMKFGSKH